MSCRILLLFIKGSNTNESHVTVSKFRSCLIVRRNFRKQCSLAYRSNYHAEPMLRKRIQQHVLNACFIFTHSTFNDDIALYSPICIIHKYLMTFIHGSCFLFHINMQMRQSRMNILAKVRKHHQVFARPSNDDVTCLLIKPH